MTCNGRVRTVVVAAVLAGLLWPSAARPQSAQQPPVEPAETAVDAAWYIGGEPITFAGNIYYPVGPRVFFNRYEMIRSGFYEGVPLYTRTTTEPFSAVFVPVGGGVMHRYERRRAGDIAGTSGSTTSAFPVVMASEQGFDRSLGVLPQAAAPPTRLAISIGDTSRELTEFAPGTFQGFTAALPPAAPVGTTGNEAPVPVRIAPVTPTGPMQTALRPKGLNGVFIDFNSRRWFNSGPAVEFSSSRFTKIGEHHGFGVYSEAGKDNTIYVALTASGGELVTPYSVRP